MAKIDTYTMNRMEGLAWALRIIDREENIEKGVDMLRKEVRFRNAHFIPLEIPNNKIREVNITLAKRILNTVLVVILKTLEEEYGFGKKRLNDFTNLFRHNTMDFESLDPYGDRYIQMSQYAEYFKEKYGIEFTEEAMDEMRMVELSHRVNEPKRITMDSLERHLKNRFPEAWEYLSKELGE